MLTNSFCHIPGVGPKTEQALWSAGVRSWESALAGNNAHSSRAVKTSWLPHLRESIARHHGHELSYFAAKLPTSQHWRLFRDFRHSCAFVDIETTGLSHFADQITTIVLYDGKTIRQYVNGQNLHDFVTDIQLYRLLVSYSGKSFDVPFIEHFFGTKLPHAHIDLRHVLRGLGYAGGLKNCERRLGIQRQESADIDGFMAVLLWHQYRRTKDRRFLETLLAYNVEDAVSLEALMVMAFNRNLTGTPFSDLALEVPHAPPLPFRADREAVAKVVRQMW
jgi:uncharacterized protein YprB with RNaseH-like and TPR domain